MCMAPQKQHFKQHLPSHHMHLIRILALPPTIRRTLAKMLNSSPIIGKVGIIQNLQKSLEESKQYCNKHCIFYNRRPIHVTCFVSQKGYPRKGHWRKQNKAHHLFQYQLMKLFHCMSDLHILYHLGNFPIPPSHWNSLHTTRQEPGDLCLKLPKDPLDWPSIKNQCYIFYFFPRKTETSQRQTLKVIRIQLA